jgi:hypothetical protein
VSRCGGRELWTPSPLGEVCDSFCRFFLFSSCNTNIHSFLLGHFLFHFEVHATCNVNERNATNHPYTDFLPFSRRTRQKFLFFFELQHAHGGIRAIDDGDIVVS